MTTAYHIADIRNVALAGHGASGKTSLADALLFTAGATNRKGSPDDGTSTLDVVWEDNSNSAQAIFNAAGTILTAEAHRLFPRD